MQPASLHAIAILFLLVTASAQGRAPGWRSARLERSSAPLPHELPPEATVQLFRDPGTVPRSAVGNSLARMVDGRVHLDGKGGIEVDQDGSNEKRTRVVQGPPTVVEWFHRGKIVQLQFFWRAKDWWLASAEAYESRLGDAQVRLLDADADGTCWDHSDYLAWRSGTFRPIGVVHEVDDGTLAGELRLLPKGRVVQIQFREQVRPEGLDEQQWLAWRACNGLRNRQGLPPTRIWPEANDGLLKHTQFLQLHAPNKESGLASYYGEPDGYPGRTDEGHAMSKAGCVAFLPEGMTTADHVFTALSMVQSRSDVLAPGLTRFGVGRTKRWSFFRMEQIGPSGTRYSVLPGAGSKDVPTMCSSNWPFPRSFPDLYQRPRGVPISVQLPTTVVGEGFRLRTRSIALFALPDLREVPGFLFSIREVQPASPEDRFYFVPGDPLLPGTDYLAQVAIQAHRSSDDGGGVTMDVELLQWQFRTIK